MSIISRTILISIVATGGCATAFKSKTTQVSVTSATPGAQVFVDGKQAGVTPTTVEVLNKSDAVISVHRDNREETCRMASNASVGWIAADLLLTGGIGLVVDWATHGWNNVGPSTCHVGV